MAEVRPSVMRANDVPRTGKIVGRSIHVQNQIFRVALQAAGGSATILGPRFRAAFDFEGWRRTMPDGQPAARSSTRAVALTVADGGRYHPLALLECERHEPVHPACRPRRRRGGDRRRRRLPRPCAVFPDGARRCRGGEGHARTHRGRGAAAELRRCRPAGPSRGRPSRHHRARQGAPRGRALLRAAATIRSSRISSISSSAPRARRTALGVPAARPGLGRHHRQARPRPHQFPRHQGRRRDHDPPLRQARVPRPDPRHRSEDGSGRRALLARPRR